MLRCTLLGAAVVASACLPVADVSLPLRDDTASCILAIEAPGGLHVQAIDLRARGHLPPLALDRGAVLTAVLYPQTLEALDLAPGEIAPVPGGPRGLPPFSAGSLWARGLDVPWQPVSALDPVLASFRFAGRTIADCLEGPGCADDLPLGVCPSTCPVPPMPVGPAPPELPDFSTCPEGWTPAPASGPPDVATCDPPALPAVTSCPYGQIQAYGAPACAPLGPACPTGEWPVGLPAGALYVRAGGAHGGRGTEAAPYGTIAEALEIAAPGATIALGRGTHAGPVVFGAPVRVVGACASDTRISRAGVARPVVAVQGDGVTLEALSIAGPGTALAVSARGLVLRGVRLAAEGTALLATGGTIAADGLSVQGGADGIALAGSTTATITGLMLEDVGHCGVGLADQAHLSLREVVARGSWPVDWHAGLCIGPGASAVVRRAIFEGYATGVVTDGARLTLEDAALRAPPSQAAGSVGLLLTCASSVSVSRLALAGNDTGISVVSTSLALDAMVAEGDPLTPTEALWVGSSTTCARAVAPDVRARHLRLEGNTSFAQGGASTVTHLADVVVRGKGRPPSLRSRLASGDGQLRLTRVAVADEAPLVLRATGPGSVLHAEDLSIWSLGSGPLPTVHLGPGVDVSLARVLLEGAGATALVAAGSPGTVATARLEDVQVRHPAGEGIKLDSHSAGTFERVVVEGPGEHGLVVEDHATALGSDVEIHGAGRLATASAVQCKGSFVLGGGAQLDVDRFWLHDDDDVGIEIAHGATVRLTNGRISHHAVGARLLWSEADLSMITGGGTVLYEDDDRALELQSE